MLPRYHNMLKFLYHNAANTSKSRLCCVQLYVVQSGYLTDTLSLGQKNMCHTSSGVHVVTNTWPLFSRCRRTTHGQETTSSSNATCNTNMRSSTSTMDHSITKNISTHPDKGNVVPPVAIKKDDGDQHVQVQRSLENSSLCGALKEVDSQNKLLTKGMDSFTDIPPVKTDKRQDVGAHTLERNFITPLRAMSDFLLKPADLDQLRKTKRRSPFENEPPITVYWRKDVETKALQVWGSKEKLIKELIFRDSEKKRRFQQNIFSVRRRLKNVSQTKERVNPARTYSKESGLLGSSGRVVLTAVVINMSNFAFKLFAWLYTGSHSMFSECVHSLADTINQLILVYGIHKSIQPSDTEHPYGYSNMKYVASLISGVGIFCVGTGLSIYHGVDGLLHPVPLQSFYWAYFILGGSLVSEGATLLVAYNSIKKGAREMQMTFSEYVLRGQDPSVNVVLMEDFAAVIGVLVAGSCMGLTSYYGSPIPDAVGSLLVGGILGSVASFIIYTNVAALVGRSIQQDRLHRINEELESDIMIRAIHDVKGIDMGNSLVRYKAEMDFDGRELTRSYLVKQNLTALLEELHGMENTEQLEEFMLKHGENIVDLMGGEIDRIEMKLRKQHPEIRHCDLEIL